MTSTWNAEAHDDQAENAHVTEEIKASGKGKNGGLRQLLENSQYRSKVAHTLYLAVTFIALGLIVGQTGPTFLDLQIITNTNLEKASAFFTAASIGYLIGSVIAGAMYSRFNKNCLVFSGVFGMGVAAAVTPYCEPYGLMIFIRLAAGGTSGFVDTAGNSEQMRIWGNEGQGLMQLLHFSFALGGILSPLYTAPFLSQRSDTTETGALDNSSASTVANSNNTSAFVGHNVTDIIFSGNFTNATNYSSEDVPSLGEGTQVHIAFLITGICAFLSGIPFFVFFVCDKVTKKTEKSKAEEKVTQRKLPLPVLLCLLGTLCVFYILYCCVEDTFASFLMTFLVRQYSSVTKAKGAYITAIYWASFAVSRFLMIFMSSLLTPVRLLYLCLTLMAIAYTSFLISAIAENVIALSVFAAMAGLSMSGIFPAGFSWTQSELLKVTGPISSCILVSASLGTMINPLILGYLMEELSNMWFCYLLVGETFVLCAVFMFLLNFNRQFANKRYGPLSSPITESTIFVEEQESQKPLSAVPNDSNVQNHDI